MRTPLFEQIRARIQREGPLPFDLFMEQALYHAEHGFYASGRNRTGPGGDFLTPVSPGPVLGQLLARQADELHSALGRPPRIRLVEQGADTGRLARDLLEAIQQHHAGLRGKYELHLLEPHAHLQSRQRQTLREGGWGDSVAWHASWDAFPGDAVPCFFYSCELVDSFPVRIFRSRGGKWREQLVGVGSSGLEWAEANVDTATRTEIQRWAPIMQEGGTVELRPSAAPWVEAWDRKISQGLVLTLDYGFPDSELFSPFRSAGTLMAMRTHRQSSNPLANPGEKDLTTHVNFTELEEAGHRWGWRNYGLVEFARGLTALAAPLLKDGNKLPDSWIRNFHHLTHPAFFGLTHRVLAQGKSLPQSFSPAIVTKL